MEGRSERKSLRFSVLGPVSIGDGERTVLLQASKPVCLLASMLLRPNQVLSVESQRGAEAAEHGLISEDGMCWF